MTRPTATPRLLDMATTDLQTHLRRHGPLPELAPDVLVRTVHEAGLTGRGGAAFPSDRKLLAVAGTAATRAARPVVVANGAEGEPASSKDRALLGYVPHLVLDGLQLAARAVGASDTVVYAPDDLLRGPIADALRQRPEAVRSVGAPDTFVSGQESAVVAAVDGRPAVPSGGPPIFERGIGRRPTLVHNVETLALLALIARHGADWFRACGSSTEPGPRLATISGAVRRPGVYELAGGAPLAELVQIAGGASEPIQALLVGGYHGGWVPWSDDTASLPWSREALRRYDAAPGAGVVVALAARHCGVSSGAGLVAYLAGQSAAQCGPCRNGLPATARELASLAEGCASPATVGELHRLVGLVEGRGACRHPDGTARLIRSTLRTFAAEVTTHLDGRCTAASAMREDVR